MIERFGKILIDNGESLGTMTESEMIEYLLNELNEARLDAAEHEDYEDLQAEISDLESQVWDLEEQLEEMEKRCG